MALFEFELAPVEDIMPWGEPGNQSLSWFALTDGSFRVVAGDEVLFRYTDEILAHWGETRRYANYQIAAFARDVLGSVAAGAARLPPFVEQLTAEWALLERLRHPVGEGDRTVEDKVAYAAFRWLGERSPWTSYLTAAPNIHFVRIGDELRIHWDNREHSVDGIPFWTAQVGTHVLPVEEFMAECRELAHRLLDEMDDRISRIEAGAARLKAEVSVPSLRQEHDTWRAEFASYFRKYNPDIDWAEAETAMRVIASTRGIELAGRGSR